MGTVYIFPIHSAGCTMSNNIPIFQYFVLYWQICILEWIRSSVLYANYLFINGFFNQCNCWIIPRDQRFSLNLQSSELGTSKCCPNIIRQCASDATLKVICINSLFVIQVAISNVFFIEKWYWVMWSIGNGVRLILPTKVPQSLQQSLQSNV